MYSYELLAYRALVDGDAQPGDVPDYFVVSDDITPRQHVDVQAAAQRWVDSSISKTINVPSGIEYEAFKGVYLYAYERGLKGCTTFRFNPENFQGVLVRDADLENTTYRFELADGRTVECKGNEEVEYGRRGSHGREPLRCAERRLLRQALRARPYRAGTSSAAA